LRVRYRTACESNQAAKYNLVEFHGINRISLITVKLYTSKKYKKFHYSANTDNE
jgi:hypothetical protein